MRNIFKRRRPDPPRYYIYLSQAKLDVLVSQIPVSRLRSLEAEVKVGLPMATAGIKSPAVARSSELAAKATVLRAYLRRNNDWVGTIENPKSYVHGVGTLPYGIMHGYRELAMFAGILDNVKVVLIGSASSMVGAAADATAKHNIDYYFVKFLSYAAKDGLEPEFNGYVDLGYYGEIMAKWKSLWDLGPAAPKKSLPDPQALSDGRRTVAEAVDQILGITPPDLAEDPAVKIGPAVPLLPSNSLSLEFLAKPLFKGNGILVATPIYVALAD
ncbi:DUF7019 family protein [Nocardia thraciensis]